MNSDQFIWTPEEYYCDELREKYANFPNQFPVIALVTMGYYGEESNQKIPAETVSGKISDLGCRTVLSITLSEGFAMVHSIFSHNSRLARDSIRG